MKILMIASWYSPRNAEVLTAGVFHYEQAMALKPYCETALYYPFDANLDTDFCRGIEKGLLVYRRKMASSRIPKMSAVKQILNMMLDLKKICAEYQPDVLHAHCGIPAGNVVSLFGKLYGYPVVITEHSPLEHMALERKSVRAQIHYAYRNSCANVCVSKDSMQRLKEQFPDCGFQVIYNGITAPESLKLEQKIYAREGRINCAIVAAFYSKDIKGYQYLLPAVARLNEAGIPITLHICGGGDYFRHYVDLAKELGIEDSCVFYGSCTREQVYSIVSQMDFNISASLYECSGVSVEEALLLGKPMLVTKSGGANSLVNEDMAVIVEKGSTEALVDGMKEMIRRLDSFDIGAIREYALNNFEIDHVSRAYMKLYQRLAQKQE